MTSFSALVCRISRVVSFTILVSLFTLGVLARAGAQQKRPNILLIVADDMGWSEAGVYGSEIFTPNIDRLANQGYQFLNFHVGSMCAPTRSMLMKPGSTITWSAWAT